MPQQILPSHLEYINCTSDCSEIYKSCIVKTTPSKVGKQLLARFSIVLSGRTSVANINPVKEHPKIKSLNTSYPYKNVQSKSLLL